MTDNFVRDTQHVRRLLAKLRQRWDQHSPEDPIYLQEELDTGTTVTDFCVMFLFAQRSRRVVRSREGGEKTPAAEE